MSSSSTSETQTPTEAPAPAPQVKQLNFPGAVNVLIQGVNIAQAKGVYTLADANLLHQAIQLVNQVMVKSFGGQQTPTPAPDRPDDNDEDVEDKVSR